MIASDSSSVKRELVGLGELGLALEEAVSTPGRRVYVTRDFYATTADQLSVFVDDSRLECLNDDDPEWSILKDRSTGRQGRVPSDIIEEAWEREARVNAGKNANALVVKEKPKRSPGKPKKRAAFSTDTPSEIPNQPPIEKTPEVARYVEYDPELEQQLCHLLMRSLDDRPGQLIRVYAGPTLTTLDTLDSVHYKTIRVDGDMTVQEMIMAAGLKYSLLKRHVKYTMYMRHLSRGTLVQLDARWRLWQVTELAKLLSILQGDTTGVDKKTLKYYNKVGSRYRQDASVEGLERRGDLDFTTQFQFVLDSHDQ